MTNACSPISTCTAPIGNLDAYTNLVHQIPAINGWEEHDLGNAYNKSDLEAAQRLSSRTTLCFVLPKCYRRYGLPVADLIQKANCLIKPSKLFDPKKAFLCSFICCALAFCWDSWVCHSPNLARSSRWPPPKAQRQNCSLKTCVRPKQRLGGWIRWNESVAENLWLCPPQPTSCITSSPRPQPDTSLWFAS